MRFTGKLNERDINLIDVGQIPLKIFLTELVIDKAHVGKMIIEKGDIIQSNKK